MEHTNTFTFLNLDIKQRKNASQLKPEEQNYAILSVLDEKNTPCKFFVFKSEVLQKILESSLEPLQKVDITYEVVFINNSWNVRLVDMNE